MVAGYGALLAAEKVADGALTSTCLSGAKRLDWALGKIKRPTIKMQSLADKYNKQEVPQFMRLE